MSYHAERLPRDVTWYCDPSGARERLELRCAGLVVREGDNTLRLGIAAVRARLENGTLKVLQGRCPNLLAESALYRYSDDPRDRHSEIPIDEHNHALGALRYMIMRLDARKLARRRPGTEGASGTDAGGAMPAKKPRRKWLSIWNEELWTPLNY